MKLQRSFEGYVIVNVDDFIMDWSFQFRRQECIANFMKGNSQTWKQWYRQGVRCRKATKTITIS